MSAAIDALLALKAHLETVTAANGYQTDIAAVAIGRAALAVGSKASLPTVTLTTTAEEPTAGGTIESGLWLQGWTRAVDLEILAAAADDWETELDAVLDDVRRALAHYPRPLLLGGVTFAPPADGGEIASAVLRLTYSYTADYT